MKKKIVKTKKFLDEMKSFFFATSNFVEMEKKIFNSIQFTHEFVQGYLKHEFAKTSNPKTTLAGI